MDELNKRIITLSHTANTTENRISHSKEKVHIDLTNKLLKNIVEKRRAYLGFAIILVILYHAIGYAETIKFLYIFYRGSIGVDIFLFLSGLGLSYSYNINTKFRFYMNRFFRIYPLFFLYAVIKSLIIISKGCSLSVWDWICNLTTLSYYQIGGNFIDWYLCATIFLYLIFPVLYKITKWQTVLIFTYGIVGLFYVYGRPYWTYECLIARIPIFLAGIMAYKYPEKLWIVVLGLLSISPVAILVIKSSPLTTCSLVFILIIGCCLLLKHLSKVQVIEKSLSFCGKYSLELYLGNCLAMTLPLPALFSNDYCLFLSYLISTTMYAFIFNLIYILVNNLRVNLERITKRSN